MKVKSATLELRGISNKVSSKGTVFYMVNVEEDDGTALSFYCPKYDSLPQGLKKGDLVQLVFDYARFNQQERLTVSAVEKVEA